MKIEFESLKEMKEFLAELNGTKAHPGIDAVQTTVTPVTPPIQSEASTVQPSVTPTVQPAVTQQVAPPVQQAPVQQAVPTTTPTYTLDDLARAGMTLMDVGRQADLQRLLTRFGVQALPALPPAQYGAFATALRDLGAQI